MSCLAILEQWYTHCRYYVGTVGNDLLHEVTLLPLVGLDACISIVLQNLIVLYKCIVPKQKQSGILFGRRLQDAISQLAGSVHCFFQYWVQQKRWITPWSCDFEERKKVWWPWREASFAQEFQPTGKVFLAVRREWCRHYIKAEVGSTCKGFLAGINSFFTEVIPLI